MTGGTIVVLGPIGGNFGAGMTGGRAYLHDPEARELPALEGASLVVSRLAEVLGPAAGRRDGRERLDELLELLRAHRQAGSALAARILGQEASIPSAFWLVEPRPPVPPIGAPARPAGVAVPDPRRPAARGGRHGPVPVNLGPAS
jgi:glutamate synthase domain-containing protein 3